MYNRKSFKATTPDDQLTNIYKKYSNLNNNSNNNNRNNSNTNNINGYRMKT